MPGMTLLVIDMLNDFFRQHAHPAEQRPQLVESVNARVCCPTARLSRCSHRKGSSQRAAPPGRGPVSVVNERA